MKRIVKAKFLSILSILFLSLSILLIPISVFADTRTKLPAPTNVRWVDGQTATLTWNAVEHTSRYIVWLYKADGTNIGCENYVTTTSIDLVPEICQAENTYGSLNGQSIYATVQAYVDSTNEEEYLRYMSSDQSSPSTAKTYSGSVRTKLPAPTNVRWVDGQTATLTWNAVEHTSRYIVWLYKADGTYIGCENYVTTTSIDLVPEICQAENTYGSLNGQSIYATVQAYVDSTNEEEYLRYMSSDQSSPSTAKTYSGIVRTKLPVPTNVRWVDGQTATLTWNAVEHTSRYIVWLYKADGTNIGCENNVITTSIDLVPEICQAENTYGSLNGQSIYATVQAYVDSTNEEYLRYMSSDQSTHSEIIQFVRPMIVDCGRGVDVVNTGELFTVLKNSLSSEQLSASDGKQLEFDFTVTDILAGSSETDEISDYAGAHDYSIGKFFDLSLIVTADGTNIGNVTATIGTVPLTADIPAELQKTGRMFFILRNHGGTITVVGSGTGTQVPFNTDRFSTYAIAYIDSNTSINPDPTSSPNQGEGTDESCDIGEGKDYLDDLRKSLMVAASLGGEQMVYWSTGDALPYDVMKTLESNPNLTLVFSYLYQEVDYRVVLHGRDVKAYTEIPWYGPLYLYGNYGGSCINTNGDGLENFGEYTVISGDTLISIAKKIGITVDRLILLNSINNPDYIVPGQRLKY